MSRAAQYRRYAAQCIELSKVFPSPSQRARILDMAEAGVRLPIIQRQSRSAWLTYRALALAVISRSCQDRLSRRCPSDLSTFRGRRFHGFAPSRAGPRSAPFPAAHRDVPATSQRGRGLGIPWRIEDIARSCAWPGLSRRHIREFLDWNPAICRGTKLSRLVRI
jgi:hypothetical protein